MLKLFKADNGMNIIGQGGKIILFTLPFAAIAVACQYYLPAISSFPPGFEFVRPYGYILLVPGLCLWFTAIVQLLFYFPKGKLICTGAYGICRNPIYSSLIVFILPAISVISYTWVYLVLAICLYVGVRIFIGTEEKQLLNVFGQDYSDYTARVGRIFPFIKP